MNRNKKRAIALFNYLFGGGGGLQPHPLLLTDFLITIKFIYRYII